MNSRSREVVPGVPGVPENLVGLTLRNHLRPVGHAGKKIKERM
jgi:hypothetical protein